MVHRLLPCLDASMTEAGVNRSTSPPLAGPPEH